MNALQAILLLSQLVILGLATWFVCWAGIGLYRACKRPTMATRVRAKPANDSRSSLQQFNQIMGRK